MEELLDVWQRLTEAGRDRPDMAQPAQGATDASIASAERRLKRPLPASLVAMLRCSRAWLWRDPDYDAVVFLPPDEIVRETKRPADAASRIDVDLSESTGVKALYYTPLRITFAYSDYFRFQIDEDPAAGGRPGQVLAVDVEEGTVKKVAESFEAFLIRGLQCIKAQLLGGYPEQWSPAPGAAPVGGDIVIPRMDESLLPPITKAPSQPVERVIKKHKPAGDELGAALLGIDEWLQAHAPLDCKRFKRGLTLLKIRQYLSNEGCSLPEAMYPLFLTVNGQAGRREPLLPCPLRACPGLLLHSLDEACDSHSNQLGLWHLYKHIPDRRYYDTGDGIKHAFWRKHWFPFARSHLDHAAAMVHLFVDYDPAPGGVAGQVVVDAVEIQPDREPGIRRVIAPSLTIYFQSLLAALDRGAIEYRDRKGLVLRD